MICQRRQSASHARQSSSLAGSPASSLVPRLGYFYVPQDACLLPTEQRIKTQPTGTVCHQVEEDHQIQEGGFTAIEDRPEALRQVVQHEIGGCPLPPPAPSPRGRPA